MSRGSRGVTFWALLLVLGLFLAAPGVVSAGDSSNNHALPYLRMGVGTRALGMGGAYVAAGNDATVGYWNPAGLAWGWGTQISGMYALGMSDDRRMEFVTASHQFDWGALGGSFVGAGMKDIEGYDIEGNPTGNFNYGDWALMAHGAYAVNYVSVGATFKYLHQGLDADVAEDGVDGFGFDIGATAKPWQWLSLGVALRDLATEIGSDEEANNVPMNLRLGTAIKPFCGLTMAFDLDHVEDADDLQWHAGTEFAFPVSEDIGAAMRLGLNDGDLTAGLGVGVKMVTFNYAFIDEPEDFMGSSHRIGVTLNFGQKPGTCARPFAGAPRSGDADLDGIADGDDACPGAAEDFDGFEDSDGCPDVDNDGDGVYDVNDDCPNRAEDFDGYQDMDGCPDVDNDGDGVMDAQDKCPNAAETINGMDDDDGCPDDMPAELRVANINFKFDSAEFSGADPLPVLEDIAKLMKKNPEMRIKVVGHTDNVGDAGYNKRLSLRRAQAVKTYLEEKGIAGDRMLIEGRGEEHPIASNDTDMGRARNRRIEFHIAN
ncbi:MAG: PorV/PorQ family protein [Candidatus Eisenbacteria bacterium]|nr:PorV/PorQ family protein [Candidatus Eisenbacteria bacterium]